MRINLVSILVSLTFMVIIAYAVEVNIPDTNLKVSFRTTPGKPTDARKNGALEIFSANAII